MAETHELIRETHSVGRRTREWMSLGLDWQQLASRRINVCGISHAVHGFRFATKGWRMGQILVCFGGRGRVQVNGRWQWLTKGEAYISPAGQPHAYHAVKGSKWGLAWMIYDPPMTGTPLEGIPAPTVVHVDSRPFRAAIAGFYRESIGRAEPMILQGWAELLQLYAARATQRFHRGERLSEVWESVDRDLAHPWTVQELADILGTSGEHLRRLCQQQLGCSPMEHVTQLRMRKAAGMLLSDRQKIDAVAWSVGYADRFGFSAAFKRFVGMSPAEYRRKRMGGGVTVPAESAGENAATLDDGSSADPI